MTSPGSEKALRLQKVNDPLHRLKELTAILREPGGCEWDRAQDFHSMKEALLEEASEVVAAVESGDPENLKEELGDLAFLVFFYCRLAEEKGLFQTGEVYEAVTDKLIFRHPHVFGNLQAQDQQEILKNWEILKESEERAKGAERRFGEKTGHLPALIRAAKIQNKASRRGFDWKRGDLKSIFAVLRSEIDELESELETMLPDERKLDRIEEELGDLLFSVVNLGRHLEVSCERSLHRSTEKFVERFCRLEEAASKEAVNPFGIEDPDERRIALERLYQKVKSDREH
jgi:tetrapyrrole methylase family protein/MazG family protein